MKHSVPVFLATAASLLSLNAFAMPTPVVTCNSLPLNGNPSVKVTVSGTFENDTVVDGVAKLELTVDGSTRAYYGRQHQQMEDNGGISNYLDGFQFDLAHHDIEFNSWRHNHSDVLTTEGAAAYLPQYQASLKAGQWLEVLVSERGIEGTSDYSKTSQIMACGVN